MIANGLAYFRERLRWRVFGSVVLLLSFAACWVSSALDPWTCIRAVGVMALLVVQFRLWDDLADRARDRVTHPGRVLGRVDARPFQRLAFALAAAGLVAAGWSGGLTPLLMLAGLNAAFAVLYGLVRPHLNDTVWRFPVLLAKYPAFVVIVAASLGAPSLGRTIVAALLTYGAAHAYEALHSGRGSAPRLPAGAAESFKPAK